MSSPPSRTLCSGLRAWRSNSAGASATCSSTNSGSRNDDLALDALAGRPEQVDRLRVIECDADVGEDAAPAALERRDRVGVEDLVARHPIPEHKWIILTTKWSTLSTTTSSSSAPGSQASPPPGGCATSTCSCSRRPAGPAAGSAPSRAASVWLNFGAHVFGGAGSATGRLIAESGVQAVQVGGRLAGVALERPRRRERDGRDVSISIAAAAPLASRAHPCRGRAAAGSPTLCRRRRRASGRDSGGAAAADARLPRPPLVQRLHRPATG